MTEPILKVRDIKKHFPLDSPIPFLKSKESVKAVDDVSFDLYPGETLGVVGESGCGKSTLARLVMRLTQPTDGSVLLEGKNLLEMDKEQLRATRKDIQMVFQNPYASLDPRKTVEQLLTEPLEIHQVGDRKSRRERVKELLEIVGLQAYHADRHPHEFSGGQRQRINIARALALNPKIMICDESVSALDVSVQAQIINLLKKLQKEFNLTYIFISHDLNVVRYMCDRILVMYLGKVVEVGSYKEIYANPQHPYTEALFSAIPKEDPNDNKERIILKGNIPSPIHPPSGCYFHERCPYAMDICKTTAPTFRHVSEGHQAACHLIKEGEK